MKKILSRILLCLGVFAPVFVDAKTLTVGSLPHSDFVDTEVATNIPFNVIRNDVRIFDVLLDFRGTASNCVQLAFGRDVDGDGELSLEEEDVTLGWWGGRVCVERTPESRRILSDESFDDGAHSVRLRLWTDAGLVPRDAAISVDAQPCFTNLVLSAPHWFCAPEWNLVRVSRSGVDDAVEWCRVDCKYNRFVIGVR